MCLWMRSRKLTSRTQADICSCRWRDWAKPSNTGLEQETVLGAESYPSILCCLSGRGRNLSLKANHRHRTAKTRRDRNAGKVPLLRPRHTQGLPKKEAGPGQQKYPFSDSTAGTAESRGWESNTEQNPGPTFRHRQQPWGHVKPVQF